MKKTNLYNLIKHKTRRVIDYINELEYHEHWDLKKINRFQTIKDKALQCLTPDKMLDTIGFNPNGIDKIYDKAAYSDKQEE